MKRVTEPVIYMPPNVLTFASLSLLGAMLACCSRKAPPEPVAREIAVDSGPTTHAIKRPHEATAELAVLTNAPPDVIAKRTSPGELAASLGPETCGAAATCDAVRAFVKDAKTFEVAVHPASEWIVPSGDALVAATEGLSSAERAKVASMPTAIVVTAHGPALPDQLPARAAFAAVASLAKSLGGYAHDDILERIEPAKAFAAHVLTEPLGARVLRDDRFSIRADEDQDAGVARLLTLGLGRFGAADVEMEGVPVRDLDARSKLVDAIAAKLVLGVDRAPLAYDDARPAAKIDLVPSTPHEGDRENVILRVLP